MVDRPDEEYEVRDHHRKMQRIAALTAENAALAERVRQFQQAMERFMDNFFCGDCEYETEAFVALLLLAEIPLDDWMEKYRGAARAAMEQGERDD